MYTNLYARLATIAEEDNDREQDLGAKCPSHLRLWLVGGFIIDDCCLIDGLNSLDDRSIDIEVFGEDNPEGAACWIVPIEHIVALRLRYPLEAEIEAARSRSTEA